MTNEWDHKAIEADARRDAAAPTEPLAIGAYVAWGVTQWLKNATTGFSKLHRVGERIGDHEMTLCGEVIPEPVMRVPSGNARFLYALGRCTHCEAINAKHQAVA